MGLVKCVCSPPRPWWIVIRPRNQRSWPSGLDLLTDVDLPPVRDDRMPLVVCPHCGRFSWADGSLADPEGRLSVP